MDRLVFRVDLVRSLDAQLTSVRVGHQGDAIVRVRREGHRERSIGVRQAPPVDDLTLPSGDEDEYKPVPGSGTYGPRRMRRRLDHRWKPPHPAVEGQLRKCEGVGAGGGPPVHPPRRAAVVRTPNAALHTVGTPRFWTVALLRTMGMPTPVCANDTRAVERD